MTDDDTLHRCVTKFMVSTCHPRNEFAGLLSAFSCAFRLGIISEIVQTFASGSSAEFHIQPMLSCIGDFDVMFTVRDIIAIPHGHTPPRELPDNYKCIVDVYEIIDSHQPGYVYLRFSHILRKNDDGHYVAEKIKNEYKSFQRTVKFTYQEKDVEKMFEKNPQRWANLGIQNNRSVQSLFVPDLVAHGPAVTSEILNESIKANFELAHLRIFNLSIDCVYCTHCIYWPTLAANWPTRYRDHGWPDQTTINAIVTKGCHVVSVVHPSCRQDERMNNYQWRLSFSGAEVTLLNSWTPLQQIIYHMLRYFLKREILTKTDDQEQDLPKLSNYHIKTLMLWECEQKPQSWWSVESSLIKLCSSLLHKLSDLVEDKNCQHYFIDNCNLIDHLVEDATILICKGLRSLANESFLLSWFIENYIRKCARYCPDDVSVLFEDIGSSDKLQRAVDAVVDWKSSTLSQELCRDHYDFEQLTVFYAIVFPPDGIWINTLMKELQHVDQRLRDYFVAVRILRVAYTISMNSLTEDLLEILWALFFPCTAVASDGRKSESERLLCIRRAIILATLSSVRSNAVETLHIEMSKAFLNLSFLHGQETVYCVVHVLFAALYYKTGHHQSAIDHCKQVLKQCDCDQCGCIGAEYLPQIDESVDAVFGLVLLYQHVQQKALQQDSKQRKSKPAFTAKLLAHYLYSKCSKTADSQYRQHLCWTESPLVYDVLLFKETEMRLGKCTVNFAVNEPENVSRFVHTKLLAQLLELVALEKLVSVRQVVVRRLHSEQFHVLNEFEALYAYKCGLLEECLDMCRQNVNMLLRAGCPRCQQYMIVMPEFLSILDGEVLSLFGIIRLLRPVFFILLVELAGAESISLLTLSVYLMVQCQKTLRSDSLCDTLQLIRVVHDKVFSANDKETCLDRLILKLTYRSLKLYFDCSASAN